MLGRGRFAARSGLVFALGLVAAGVLDGQPSFPIALSNPPPLGATTPAGGDALDEVVRAGVTLFRVGPFSVPWTSDAIAQTKAWDQAASIQARKEAFFASALSKAEQQRLNALLRKLMLAFEATEPESSG